MPKQLNVDDILECAMDMHLNGELDDETYGRIVNIMEKAATEAAQALAKVLKVEVGPASWEGKAFAGLCAPFFPGKPRQKCPDVLDACDEGGDWIYHEYMAFVPEARDPIVALNAKPKKS